MPYLILNKDGKVIGDLQTDEEADAFLSARPDAVYSFPIGGSAADVDTFMKQLNSGSPSFFELLVDKYGALPAQINPMKELQDLFFGSNSFFVNLHNGPPDPELAGQLFSVLQQTVPAGSGFFVLEEPLVITDGGPLPVSESLGIFYAITDTETGIDSTERITLSPGV